MIPPTDRTFNLVMNKGGLDYLMCSSDQIKRRVNMYRDNVERVLRMGDLEDEDSDNNNNKVGGGWYNDDTVDGKKYDEEAQEEFGDNHVAKKNNKKKNPHPPFWVVVSAHRLECLLRYFE